MYIHVLEQNLGPQERAMLGALYSRSTKSVVEHLEKARTEGASFMERFYIGYGHDSIGDMGECQVFFEGVSIPAAVSIEHHPLFRGQECSTRYIDFSDADLGLCGDLGRKWMGFYQHALEFLKEELTAEFDPRTDAERRAVNARAFDRARGFLPAGVKTNVAFYSTFRTAQDHLCALLFDPLPEVADAALTALRKLAAEYPTSFKPEEKWHSHGAKFQHLYVRAGAFQEVPSAESIASSDGLDVAFSVRGALDYASWRDLHRHRTLRMRLPEFRGPTYIHPFYMSCLPNSLREEAETLMALTNAKADNQYAWPIGCMVAVDFKVWEEDLPYVVTLRTTPHVHPTLQVFMRELNDATIQFDLPPLELREMNWKRGDQTIVEKV